MDIKLNYYYLSILSKIMTFMAKCKFYIKRNLKSEFNIKVNSLRKRQGKKKK